MPKRKPPAAGKIDLEAAELAAETDPLGHTRSTETRLASGSSPHFENAPTPSYISTMCGRITQKSNPKVLGLKIATLVEPLFEAPPRYNGAPSQQHWVIRQHPETGERTLDRLTWGLIP